jgi:hypothetical protein
LSFLLCSFLHSPVTSSLLGPNILFGIVNIVYCLKICLPLNHHVVRKESIPFIFNDESTGSCICLRLDLYMSHVKIICVSADSFYFSYFPHPSRSPRPHMCIRNAYVSVAVNVPAVTSRYHVTVRDISKVTRKSAA